MTFFRRVLGPLGLATATALLLTACGSDSASTTDPTATSTSSTAVAGAGGSAGSTAAGSTSSNPSISTGAGSSSAGTVDGTFPVTVKNSYGDTTIAQAPTRVATVSWVNPDVALALGVVPVGMDADSYGANAARSTDWKDQALAALGASIGTAKAPKQWDVTNGINYDAIAESEPDVILAAYSV